MKTKKPLGNALRLEIESDPAAGQLVNLVRNPSGELGGFGWVTPVSGSTLVRSGVGTSAISLRYDGVPGASWFTTENMPVVAGHYVAATLTAVSATGTWKLRFEWVSLAGAVISSSTQSGFDATALAPVQAPASTAYVRLRVDLYNVGGANPTVAHNFVFREVTVAAATTVAALATTRINLVTNPSFETDTTGWSPERSVYMPRDTTEHVDGVASVKLTGSSYARRVNQVVNPSFETGITGWVEDGIYAGSVSQGAAGVVGTKSLQLNGPAYVGASNSVHIPVTAGQSYTLSAWARVSSMYQDRSDMVSLDVCFNGGDEGRQGITWRRTELTPMTWLRRSRTFTVPAGMSYVTLFAYTGDQMAAGDYAQIDGILLESGSTLGSYFDGSFTDTPTTDYFWTGTAHASTSTFDTLLPSTGAGLKFTTPIDVTALLDYTVSFSTRHATGAADQPVDLALTWINASGAVVLTTHTAVGTATSAWQRFAHTTAAPGGATKLRVTITFASMAPNDAYYIDAVMVEQASTLGTFIVGTVVTPNLSYIQPIPYINVLGPSHEVSIVRETLNVGTLSATIVDAALDPSQSTAIRPGRAVRLMAFSDTTKTWRHVFSGTATHATVSYDLKEPQASRRARIEMTAVDNAQVLANQNRRDGVATIAELPAVLEGAGVPWNVNGSGNQVPTPPVVASNDNASALDQVAVTRDSVLGYSWIDRMGTLQAWDRDLMPTKTVIGPELLSSDQRTQDNATPVWAWNGVFGTFDVGGAVVRSTTHPASGTYCVQATTTVTTKGHALTTFFSGMTIGKTYVATGKVWIPSGSPDVALDALFMFRGTPTKVRNQWAQISVTFVANATDVFLAYISSPSTTSGSFYLDDVSLKEATATPVLDENSYNDVVVGYDSESLINEVNLKFLRINPGTGETEEVAYPNTDHPLNNRNEDSIREWGPRSAEFTIQGIAEETADLQEYIDAVLAVNSTPKVQLTSMELTVDLTDDWSAVTSWYAFVDLYDFARVNCARASISNHGVRVTGIKHVLSGPSSTWTTELNFTTPQVVASPSFVPSPLTGEGGQTIGELLRPIGEVTMFFGAKTAIPAGWLAMDGTTFSAATYPKLAAHLGSTTLPNMTDRAAVGAGNKALGTVGGSPTATLATTNLPSHNHGGVTGVDSPDHVHAESFAMRYVSPSGNAGYTAGTQMIGNQAASTGGASARHTHTITAEGSGTPFATQSPWLALWHIIRAA